MQAHAQHLLRQATMPSEPGPSPTPTEPPASPVLAPAGSPVHRNDFRDGADPANADANTDEAGRSQAVRHAGVVSATTLLSRVLGLARDVAAAALFGAGWVWDAFVLAFLLPNLFRRLFGEGALSAAFIPVYTRTVERDGPGPARRLLGTVSVWLLLLLGLVSLAMALGVLLAPEVTVGWLFGADDAAKQATFERLVPVLAPFVVMICLTAFIGGALNVHGSFFVPAFAPVIQNVVLLAGIGTAAIGRTAWGWSAGTQVMAVAIAVLIGGALGLAHHLQQLYRVQARERAAVLKTAAAAAPGDATDRDDDSDAGRMPLRDPRVRAVGEAFVPTVLGLGVLQLSVLLDSVIAEMFVPGDGAVSALYYGNRLMQFPLALIGVAMGIAIFPLLARHVARDEHAAAARALSDATRLTLFLAIPAGVALVVLAGPIIEVVFRWGAFSAEDARRTTWVMAAYSLGLVAACVRMLQTRAYFALGDPGRPTRVALLVVGLNVVLNLILVHTPLREAGLALSTALTTWLGAYLLSRGLRTRLPEPSAAAGASGAPTLASGVARATVAAALMGAVVGVLALWVVPTAFGGWTNLAPVARIAGLGGVIAIGIGTYLGVTAWLRAPELARYTWRPARRTAQR